jgi:hypothetical protein
MRAHNSKLDQQDYIREDIKGKGVLGISVNTQSQRGYHISISGLMPSYLCRVSSPFSLRQQSPGPHPQTLPQSRTVSTRWASGRLAE